MIIDCVADLHGDFPKLSGGDLLLLCGDYTATDHQNEWKDFFKWLGKQNYRKKIMIGGNHDNYLYKNMPIITSYYQRCMNQDVEFDYLHDSFTEFEGLKIYGSPWSYLFPGINVHCTSFTGFQEDIDNKFESIPNDVDILMTHMPPYGIFDLTKRKENVGSKVLREMSMKIAPKLHVFGHIHECGGRTMDTTLTRFVNASLMDGDYESVNKPIRIIL